MSYREQHKRSILKTATFRAAVLVSDFVIVTAITHRYELALGVIILSNAASTVLYYIHERMWEKISWGRRQPGVE